MNTKHGLSEPATRCAGASLACSSIGLVVALLGTLINYQRLAGGTAGIGAAFVFLLVALVSGAFCLSGAVLGTIALFKIRRGAHGSRAKALTGFALGNFPLVCLAAYLLFAWLAPIIEMSSRKPPDEIVAVCDELLSDSKSARFLL